MPPKPTSRTLFAVLALLAATLTVLPAVSAQAPRPIGKTFLEGMAMDDNGEPLYKQQFVLMTVTDRTGGDVYKSTFSSSLGGLYHVELKAGVYEILVVPQNSAVGHLRPLRLHGVLVKPGKTNRLNITMHEGSTLEEIGAPIDPTLPAIIISDKLDSLQKQVDALKAQVAVLKVR